jgi:antibiotic biosynthesis monooxygenase (ABM) superfamily enzyme
MSNNDVTGDPLRTKLGNKEQQEKYAEGFDRIFGKKKKPDDKEEPYWKRHYKEGEDD